jgi:DNA-binding FadR family transcriptional regulator
MIRNLECPKELETHDNVSNLVVEMLRKYILENNLTTGDKLPSETQLESVLHVSRPSIREAMKSLESAGIITTIHGKGRFIRDFNYDQMVSTFSYNLKVHFKDFQEVVQLRKGLESYFLPQALDLMCPEDFDALELIFHTMEKETEEGKSYKELVESHTQFHIRLYKPINNKLLNSLISMFATFQRLRETSDISIHQDNILFLKKHRELLDELESHDLEGIKRNMAVHFSDFDYN